MERLRGCIRGRLVEKEMSLRDAAKAGGISHATIADELSGKTKPRLRFYKGVAKALGVSVEYLLDLGSETPAGTREDDGLMGIMATARRLPPEQVRALRDYARWPSAQARGRRRDARRQADGAA